MKRFWIFMGMFALVPFCMLSYVPLAIQGTTIKGAIWTEVWAGAFIAVWLALLLAMLLWKLFSRFWQWYKRWLMILVYRRPS